MVLIGVARSDHHQLGFLFRQHVAVIRVSSPGVRALRGPGASGLVGIRQAHQFDAGMIVEDDVQIVTVVAAAGVANDGRAPGRWLERGQRAGGAGQDGAASDGQGAAQKSPARHGG